MRRLGLIMGLALVAVAACGGDDTDEAENSDVVSETDADDDGGDRAPSDPILGNPQPGELVLGGAIEATFAETQDDVRMRAGGGCLPDEFGMSAKVDVDEITVYDVIVTDVQTTITSDTRGAFDATVIVDVYEDGARRIEQFEGPGTITIVDQDTTNIWFTYELAGTIPSNDDPTRSLDVDFGWAVQVVCP